MADTVYNPRTPDSVAGDNWDDGESGPSNPNSSGGYGGGGGGVDKEAVQNQILNTQGNYAKRKGEMDKMAKDQLGNIEKQFDANNALLKQQNATNMKNVQWQPNQQKEQSALMAMRNRMGNAAYGSSLADLREGMGRIDDMNDVSLINAYRQNADNAYSNWFQANASLVSDYNDQVTSLEDEYSKLYSQYWSTLSNIDPTMALQKNMELAAKRGRAGEKGKVKDGDYYIEPFDLEPDEELRSLMYQKEHASPVNPMTKSYVRPDQGHVLRRQVAEQPQPPGHGREPGVLRQHNRLPAPEAGGLLPRPARVQHLGGRHGIQVP
jgi:hypothetical protein